MPKEKTVDANISKHFRYQIFPNTSDIPPSPPHLPPAPMVRTNCALCALLLKQKAQQRRINGTIVCKVHSIFAVCAGCLLPPPSPHHHISSFSYTQQSCHARNSKLQVREERIKFRETEIENKDKDLDKIISVEKGKRLKLEDSIRTRCTSQFWPLQTRCTSSLKFVKRHWKRVRQN